MIKAGFFRSRSLARCSIPARLTFQGLWAEADPTGRGIADPRILKGAVWPLDDDITPDDVAEHLDELAREHIQLYEVDGEAYYAVRNWEKNQAASYRTGKPEHPEPPEQNPEDPEACTEPRAACTGNRALSQVKSSQVKPPVTSADADITAEEFQRFWDLYPARDGKKLAKNKALAAWKRLSKAKHAQAMTGVKHYADSGQRPKDAFRWLREECWTDWQTPANPDGPRPMVAAAKQREL